MKFNIYFPYVLTDEYGENPKEITVHAVGSYTAGTDPCAHPVNEAEFLEPGSGCELDITALEFDGVKVENPERFEDVVLQQLRG